MRVRRGEPTNRAVLVSRPGGDCCARVPFERFVAVDRCADACVVPVREGEHRAVVALTGCEGVVEEGLQGAKAGISRRRQHAVLPS